ncbi:MAG: alpha/beta fold hydrolase [Planctomycetota bacterium]
MRQFIGFWVMLLMLGVESVCAQVAFTDDALAFDREAPYVGFWLGNVNADGNAIAFSIDVQQGEDVDQYDVAARALQVFGPTAHAIDGVIEDDALVLRTVVGGSDTVFTLSLREDAQRLIGTVLRDDGEGAPYDIELQRSLRAVHAAGQQVFTGVLNVQQVMELDMTILFGTTLSGRRVGHIDVPAQGIVEFPLINIVEHDGEITATFPAPAPATITGRIVENGSRFVGTFEQATMTIDVDFERAEDYTPTSLSRPQKPEAPYPYETRDVVIEHTDGHRLAGTLTTPSTEGPWPIAIFISGSGPQDRDEALMGHQPFLVIADHLTRHGIATLRCDDRGVSESSGEFEGATSLDFASDVNAQVRWLQGEAASGALHINCDQIGLIGHSEGGLIAPIVACDVPELGFIVLLAGPGVTGKDILAVQSELLLAASGVEANAAAELAASSQRLIAALLADDFSEDAWLATFRQLAEDNPMLAGLTDDATDDDVDAAAQNFLETMNGPWMRYFLEFDPTTYLRGVSCPVFALNGTLDLQVWHDQNLPPIIDAVRAGGGDITARRYEGLNHLFQPATTGAVGEYAQIETTIDPLVLEDLVWWIYSVTGSNAR